jgi:hypothetical protein
MRLVQSLVFFSRISVELKRYICCFEAISNCVKTVGDSSVIGLGLGPGGRRLFTDKLSFNSPPSTIKKRLLFHFINYSCVSVL